ncbi:thioesterase [Marinobacterium nitratireducens]|uniref:Thioesterase n=1 Tax=Marinobacterium nitratireducens TaxID=518897 RepID=A0A917ZCQ0_9GAMM|nr:alpha/beta fold hydrolase [Marinobacterium nitratireducens]GGO80868.1 thioesterase [Marinobacterium nitratireducens]
MSSASLFVTPEARPAARARLICFPFAGGDINAYLPWLSRLDPQLELVIVQLPGRGQRARERPFARMDLLVDELFGNMLSRLDKPFAFFGHSMGGKIAYELAKRLQREQLPLPELFVASGSGSPCLPRRGAPVHRLPDALFKEKIRELSGVPRQVLENEELMAFVLPILKADFKLVESYAGRFESPLSSRLLILGGNADTLVTRDELLAWRELFVETDGIRLYDGGHFFINQHSDDIIDRINVSLLGGEVPMHRAS